MSVNESFQVRVWHVLAFVFSQLAMLGGLAFWVGSEARQIEVNSERISITERIIEDIQRNGTTNSRVRLDDIVQRLKDLDEQMRQHRRRGE